MPDGFPTKVRIMRKIDPGYIGTNPRRAHFFTPSGTIHACGGDSRIAPTSCRACPRENGGKMQRNPLLRGRGSGNSRQLQEAGRDDNKKRLSTGA
ncbi:MAG: hypothetical protein DRH10_06640 [Deltaproteobacteria bacterium]|nr:MAG: hypothetical protein DRH10_06640 [Deltaproteobacteria bacterium]